MRDLQKPLSQERPAAAEKNPTASDLNMPQVAIIILNWNNRRDTITCLASIFSISYPNYLVILADNGSTDDTIPAVRDFAATFSSPDERCKGVDVIEAHYTADGAFRIDSNFQHRDGYHRLVILHNNANLGFAEGNNVAMRLDRAQFNSRYVLLLNNDTEVEPDFLSAMVEAGQRRPDVGFVGPKVCFYDARGIIQAAGGGRIKMRRGEAPQIAVLEPDVGQRDADAPIDYVAGCCMLVKAEVLQQVGMFDSRFFMYWEETDWCVRGRRAGYNSWYAHKAKIYHKQGGSAPSAFSTYWITRNMFFFLKKNATKRQYRSFLLHFFCWKLWHSAASQLLGFRSWEGFKALARGVWHGVQIDVTPARAEGASG